MPFSELRQDLVSGDWIVVAPKRRDRPQDFKDGVHRKRAPKKGCPFEDPRSIDHSEPILQVNDKKGWALMIVENKYPAFSLRDTCSVIGRHGPYAVTDGIGHHDLLITRDHDKNFPKLSPAAAFQVFRAFQDRYLMLSHDSCISYVSIFHNWGPKAGASLYHPHYQIVAIPVVPPDFQHSVSGSRKYFAQHKKCVHCAMIDWERKEKKRIIFENAGAIAFAPFVSRGTFEVRIFPKRHLPYFEDTSLSDLSSVVEALQASLRMVTKALKDPDYNFFIHTAPVLGKKRHGNYHWHLEILPKVSVYAGFELGTGIEINAVDPDPAAKILRGR